METININDIKPAPYNPRTMNAKTTKALTKNIKKFGLVDPIIINLKNNHIIGGHQRFKVLQQEHPQGKPLNIIKRGDIGWVFPETNIKIEDLNQEKALNLALNNIKGEFNNNLGAVLNELQKVDYDLELAGFDEIEILDINLNYELETLESNNKPTTPETIPDNEVNTETRQNTETEIKIKFSTETQRKQFLNFIQQLKEKQPQKRITQLLIEHMKQNINRNNKNITPYTIILNEKEKQQFNTLYKELEKKYFSDPLTNYINDTL